MHHRREEGGETNPFSRGSEYCITTNRQYIHRQYRRFIVKLYFYESLDGGGVIPITILITWTRNCLVLFSTRRISIAVYSVYRVDLLENDK